MSLIQVDSIRVKHQKIQLDLIYLIIILPILHEAFIILKHSNTKAGLYDPEGLRHKLYSIDQSV